MPIPDWIKKNEFLETHLKYTDNTESPKIMQLWSAIGTAAACLGRHAYLDRGIGKLFPNMYILLVGPPGTRKNFAINYAVNLAKDCTQLKFAPDDTGGQRQGLIVAIENAEQDHIQHHVEDIMGDIDSKSILSNDVNLNSLGNININLQKQNLDKHTLFIKATEFGSFLGQGSIEMTRFLIKMWDGEDYRYKIRKESYVLKDASLNMLGGTTSSDLAALLPVEAIGQGFMSRIVLVFAPKREKHVPPSKAGLYKKYEPKLIDIYKYLFYEHVKVFKMSKEAENLEDKLYYRGIQIPDTRFLYYSERRADHLSKVAMILAATNKRTVISADDIYVADMLLAETEKSMPDALGEYGLSPIALARQKMSEFLHQANGPVRHDILWAMMRRDMRMIDFKNCIADLINAKKISEVKDAEGEMAFVFNETSDELMNLLEHKDIVNG